MKLTIKRNIAEPIEVELEPCDLELETPCTCKLGKIQGRKCWHCDGSGWFITPIGNKLLEFLKRHHK